MIFITLMLPVEVRIIPTYAVMADFGTDQHLHRPDRAADRLRHRDAAVPPGLPGVPDELVEAARMDGAGPWRFLRDILLPVSAANIAALFVILFVYGWNQYLWPLLVATDPRLDTIVIGIVKMIGVETADGVEPGDGDRGAGAAAAGRRGRADAALVRRRA